jgi:hypothetical protein
MRDRRDHELVDGLRPKHLRYEHFCPLAQIPADLQVGRVLGDKLDSVAETVGRDHLFCLGGDPRRLFAARHPSRPGACRHHREKAGTSPDIQDRPPRRDTPNRLVIRGVSRHIIHHREVPGGYRLRDCGLEIDAGVQVTRVDLQRTPIRRHGLVDLALGEMKSTYIADSISVTGVDLERAHESAVGLLTLPEPNQHESELAVKLAIVRLDGDCLA